MPMNAPPILCKHPMLATLEALAANADALGDLIERHQERRTARRTARLDRAVGSGLFAGYSDDQKPDARAKLLGVWGDNPTLLRISDALGEALDLVRRTGYPLRCWWAAGATAEGGSTAWSKTARATRSIYLVLLTPPMGDEVAANKAFDAAFRDELQAQAAAAEGVDRLLHAALLSGSRNRSSRSLRPRIGAPTYGRNTLASSPASSHVCRSITIAAGRSRVSCCRRDGQVRGVAEGRPDHAVHGLDVADEGLTGRDADAGREVAARRRAARARRRRSRAPPRRPRASLRASGSRRPEHRHHAVAVELDDGAAVTPRRPPRPARCSRSRPRRSPPAAARLGEVAVAADVHEQHRDLDLAEVDHARRDRAAPRAVPGT